MNEKTWASWEWRNPDGTNGTLAYWTLHVLSTAVFWVVLSDGLHPISVGSAFWLVVSFGAALGPAVSLSLLGDVFPFSWRVAGLITLAALLLLLEAYPRSGDDPRLRIDLDSCQPVGVLNLVREKMWPVRFWGDQTLVFEDHSEEACYGHAEERLRSVL